MPESTSVQDIVIWVVALTAIVNFVTNFWTIFSGPSRKNANTLAEHATTLSRIEARLQSVELKQASQPTTEVMHQLELALAGIRGDLKSLAVEMEGQSQIFARLEAMVDRHDNHLMKR